MTPHTALDEHQRQRLAAYHDGELGRLARWRVRHWLARDPRARRELEGVAVLGELLREEEALATTPDLWPAIEVHLRRRTEPVEASHSAPWHARWMPAGALAAAAATALVLAVGLDWGDAPDPRSVRWLDAGDHSAAVLQDDSEATIIWILDTTDQASRRIDREGIYARWQEVVGDEIASHTRVIDVKGGILYVEVDSAPLLQELATYNRQQILEGVRRIGEFGNIQDIRFRAGVF